jgi:hypothetical protein
MAGQLCEIYGSSAHSIVSIHPWTAKVHPATRILLSFGVLRVQRRCTPQSFTTVGLTIFEQLGSILMSTLDLTPFHQFLDPYQHSHFATVYIFAYTVGCMSLARLHVN